MSKNQEYVSQYAGYAMEQMQRYGIPASVTLAQGILESSNGQSELSRKGNNHFGIKATQAWLNEGGDYLVYTDDRPNEKFCRYASVADSYEHHSRFLKGNTRYAQCFQLAADDYKGWSEGLAKAGYASNPKYAEQLQQIIEKNGLAKYDRMVMASSASLKSSVSSSVASGVSSSVSPSTAVAPSSVSSSVASESEETKSQSASNWMQQLLGTDQEGLSLNQGENSLLEMIVSLFTGLMTLANQLDSQKSAAQQVSSAKISQASSSEKKAVSEEKKAVTEVDLRMFLPGASQCMLVRQGEQAFLHLKNGDVEVHRQLTEVERSRLAQALQSPNLTDVDKQARVTSFLKGVVINHQLSQNYEQGMEAQQSQRTARSYSFS